MSRVEKGYIPNKTSYVELFMNTMKTNNFCDGYQYEMQKSWDGGKNYAYRIFTSCVEEGYIPNTISYVELFMNTMKIKNNFCNGHQYEKAGMEERIVPVKSFGAGRRRKTFQTQYPMCNCSWLP